MFNRNFIYLNGAAESGSERPESVDQQIDDPGKRYAIYAKAENLAKMFDSQNKKTEAGQIRSLVEQGRDADKVLTSTQPGSEQESADAQENALFAARELLKRIEGVDEAGTSFDEYAAKYRETRRYLEGFATGKALKDTDVNKDIYQTEAQNALAKMDEMVDPSIFGVMKESEKRAQLQNLSDTMSRFSTDAGESSAIREGAGNAPEWLTAVMDPELQHERENLEIRGNNAVSAAVGRVIDKGLGTFTSTISTGGNTKVEDLPGNYSVDLGNIEDVESNVKKELKKVSSVNLAEIEDGYNWNIEDRGIKVRVVKTGSDNRNKPEFEVKVVEADKGQYGALAKAIEEREQSTNA